MDRDSLELLEFDRVLQRVASLANSDASAREVLAMMPLAGVGEIRQRQGRIAEIMKMMQEGVPLRLSPFGDIGPLLTKVRPEGAVLEAAELATFVPVLSVSGEVSSQIEDRPDLPMLREMTADLTGRPDLLRSLRRSVDHEGNILDSASFLLSDLRERSRRLDARIAKKLEEIVRDERVSVFLQDDFITKRSGRWVIPVRMDSKGQVAGVVHDVSKSGETAFMEPLAIIGLANELENLVAEQKAEEIRVLRELSRDVRRDADAIEAGFRCLVQLDSLDCIARFGDSLAMALPEINDTGMLRLAGARHPLLMLAFRDSGTGREVVPLEVELGGASTVMVITGSNAGGKTIAIKTVGLLAAMALAGMPVPASASSSIPLVTDLPADIGDEQSIEANLSTFAAHVGNIAAILQHASPGSLVLIDELGTGTDPSEGAALACAVLAELRSSGALVFATTHLADIKGFVHRTEGMINASMEFDQRTLTPLYRLRIGEPGQSYALETALRYGLPERVIASARSMLGSMKVEFDNLVADLNRTRAAYEEQLAELGRRRAALEDREQAFAERTRLEQERQREAMEKALTEASDIVLDTKRRMTALMEDFRKKERAERREAMRKAEEAQQQLQGRLRAISPQEAGISPEDLVEGETVFVRPLGRQAVVVKVIQDKRVKVRSGMVEIEVEISDISGGGKLPPAQPTAGKTDAPAGEFAPSRLSLLGMRVDEALSELEPFLNHAALAGYNEVVIIHGIGTGALSRAVSEHLTGHPLIKGFRKGSREEGGAGVTIATLK